MTVMCLIWRAVIKRQTNFGILQCNHLSIGKYLKLNRISKLIDGGHLPRRCIHLATKPSRETSVKLIEEENEYFHKYLETNEKYQPYLLQSGSEIQQCNKTHLHDPGIERSDVELLRSLKELSCLTQEEKTDLMGNDSFKQLCCAIMKRLTQFNHNLFWDSTNTLTEFEFRRCVSIHNNKLRLELAGAYDKEFVRRRYTWDLKTHFLAADFFYHFRCSAFSTYRFMSDFMTYMETNLHQLSSTEMIMLMFHVNLYRNTPPSLLTKLSEMLHTNIHEFSCNDLGVITSGFFKSKTNVKNNKLLDAIVFSLGEIVETVDEVPLASFMKYIQRLTHQRMVKAVPHTINALIDLQPTLLTRIPEVKVTTALNIVSMYENIHNITEAMISELCRKLIAEDIRDWRIKDLARLCKLLGHLSSSVPESKEALCKIVDEISHKSRETERKRYLDSLCNCLLGLSMVAIYPHNLLQEVFSDEAHSIFSEMRMDFRRDLYQLSESVKIEVPEYSGPFYSSAFTPISHKKRKSLQILKGSSPLSTNTGSTMRESILQNLVQLYSHILGGQEFVRVGFLLPHYQTPDIEVRIHPCGKGVPVSKWKVNGNGGRLSTAISQNGVASRLFDMATRESTRKIAVLLHGINAYYTLRRPDGSVEQTLSGLHASKGRQLQKLGYEVVQIPFFEFSQVLHKSDYLKTKTFGTFFDDLD